MRVLLLGKNQDFEDTIKRTSRFITENMRSLLKINVRITTDCKASSLVELKSCISDSCVTEEQFQEFIATIAACRTTEALQFIRTLHKDVLNLEKRAEFCRMVALALSGIVSLENLQKYNIDVTGCQNPPTHTAQYLENIVINSISYFKTVGSAENPIIERAVNYINQHYAEDIGLKEISEHVSLNPTYFSSYFKQHTGEKYVDFLIKVRMEKAKYFIESENDCKMYTLAERVGYKSTPHFYKVFRAYFGSTPSKCKAKLNEGER